MTNALLGRLDALVGDGIESGPARQGCELEVLIDGSGALPEIARAMSEAKRFVPITGWYIAPSFELDRARRPHSAIGVLLAELAQRVDVRVLVW
jgi:hypothetical protein